MIEKSQIVDITGLRIATVLHSVASKKMVIYCHGFRSSKIGPSRLFVRMARQLQDYGVVSLRFDQFGSGDSEGDFYCSSFDQWIATTKHLVQRYRHRGYEIALLGQSMGGSTVLAVAGELCGDIASVVAWVPDPSVDEMTFDLPFDEEGGQRVDARFWQEAHDAKIVERYAAITAPTLVYLATDDVYVSVENRAALIAASRGNHEVRLLDGWTHSGWSFEQATEVLETSCSFILSHFSER